MTVNVNVTSQGGMERPGVAVARKGRQLLVQYRIGSGDARERWFSPSRYVVIEGDVDSLPRYKARTCPAVKWERELEREELPGYRETEYGSRIAPHKCEKCGGEHRYITRIAYTPDPNGFECMVAGPGRWAQRWVYTGLQSLKLADELVTP